MKVWVGLLAFGMLAVAPAASATLLNRNFVSAAPAAQWTSPNGAGIYDPADPNNTCVAVLGVRSEDAQNFYYTNLRVASGLVSSGTIPGVAVSGSGTPIDDCFGLTNPGNFVGVSSSQADADFFYNLRGILGVTETAVLSNDTWATGACPIASASVVQGPPGLLPITGVTLSCSVGMAATDVSAFVTATAAGSVSTGFAEPTFLGLGLTTSSAVQTCYTAALFDSGTGIISAPVSDESWMFGLTADASAVAGSAFASALDAANNLMNQDNLVANDGCA